VYAEGLQRYAEGLQPYAEGLQPYAASFTRTRTVCARTPRGLRVHAAYLQEFAAGLQLRGSSQTANAGLTHDGALDWRGRSDFTPKRRSEFFLKTV